MARRIAVRKILTATAALRSAYTVSLASLLLSAAGLALYTWRPSGVVLMESFVWLVEAMSFGGLALAFKVAASRTIVYRARYEILRIESLAVLLAALASLAVSLAAATRNLFHDSSGPTPLLLAAYPLASGAASYLLERLSLRSLDRAGIDMVAVRMIAKKLGLDTVFEVSGGLAVVASNMIGTVLPEKAAVAAMSVYVAYSLLGAAREAAMHLVGVVPRSEYLSTFSKVEAVLRRYSRHQRIRRLRVESYGTFREVELWLEAPPDMTLGEAHREAMRIARLLVHEIPEILRALVVLVPERGREAPRSPRRGSGRAAARPATGSGRSSRPPEAPLQRGRPPRRSGASGPGGVGAGTPPPP